MYRFFCKRKRLFPLLFVGIMLSSLIILIFDDTFDKEDRHARHKNLSIQNFKEANMKRIKFIFKVTPELKQHAKTRSENENSLLKEQVEVEDPDYGSKDEDELVWDRDQMVPDTKINPKLLFEPKVRESVKSGTEWKPPPNAGEQGRPVKLDMEQLSPRQRQLVKQGKEQHRFNEYVSNLISIHRSLPDPREPECLRLAMTYRKDLPKATVVIIFHDEAWSTLLRTVHSVLDRSPPHLLQEIILVDDFSDIPYLRKPLEDYVSKLKIVKVVHSESRVGLITARLIGLRHVTTPVVVYLDSYCECTEGWLEPLLDRITRDPTTVVAPVIETIDEETFRFSYTPSKSISVGTFNWNMLFGWMAVQPSEKIRRKSDNEPIRSPTMAGGLFAIDKNFFYKLGTYDTGMKIWGGENTEISFRIWMCGGTLETIPCSHVGHVFRRTSPHFQGGIKNYLTENAARTAAVWLDEYITYFTGWKIRNITADLKERQALRQRLKCHSFAWYLKHVVPELFVPGDRIAHGPIQNEATGQCLHWSGYDVSLKECSYRSWTRRALNWYMNKGQSTIFQEDRASLFCLDYSHTKAFDRRRCHGQGGNQLWKYSKDLKQLYHVAAHRCVEVSAGGVGSFHLVMSPCDPSNPRQRWLWDTSPVTGPSWRKDEAAGKPIL